MLLTTSILSVLGRDVEQVDGGEKGGGLDTWKRMWKMLISRIRLSRGSERLQIRKARNGDDETEDVDEEEDWDEDDDEDD